MYFLKFLIAALLLILEFVLTAYIIIYSGQHRDIRYNRYTAMFIFVLLSSFSGIAGPTYLLFKDFPFLFVWKHAVFPYLIALPITLCLIYCLCRFTPQRLKDEINRAKRCDNDKFGFCEYYVLLCVFTVIGCFFLILNKCGYINPFDK